eukprot:16161981-Heterocapsa_arctica.AAC.1
MKIDFGQKEGEGIRENVQLLREQVDTLAECKDESKKLWKEWRVEVDNDARKTPPGAGVEASGMRRSS